MTATYRLQLHDGFTFADAEARLPYLADLGITHLYLSPVLRAVPGSMHGYDVLDHTRVSDELGGEDGLVSLADTARQHGLGLVVDVVPNHMAFVAPEHANAALWQVLREGRDAPTAHWFDVDWEYGEGRLGIPVLGGTLREVLDAGEIALDQHAGEPVLRYFDHVFPVAPGTESDDVEQVLARQHYELASWREADTVLNYRRFFDVSALIAVRVELPDVFEATHRLLLDLHHRGVIDGFRIDHPDGLADPDGYLEQLRAATLPGTPVWVEKILEGSERLPGTWACEGTTGYDAMAAISTALVDPVAAPTLDRTWTGAGGDLDLVRVIDTAKRLVVTEVLGPEVHRLTRRALEIIPDADPGRIAEAVVEMLVAGRVYRAYVRPGHEPAPVARERLEDAYRTAVLAHPELRPELELVLGLTMTGARREPAADDFAVRFQQTWGPVMAKGIEDTTFYRWHRLDALNEVGGDPGVVEQAGSEELHAWAAMQQQAWASGMTALSTHDTKRSEDVRARLLAVAGDTVAWEECSELFAAAADEQGVDRPTAHLLWQTLVGAGEISTERLHTYLTKAVREAKMHTAWVDGDPDYEARALAMADRALAPGPLRSAVENAVADNLEPIRATVLGQKLLQLLLPGVPDTYQGCEVLNLCLVDPDNRREVDYDAHHLRLRQLRERGPVDLADEKLLVTTRALAVRRELPRCFEADGAYLPLQASTEHVVGLLRGGRVAAAAVRAPRRLADSGGWQENTVTLPPGTWHDELTGAAFAGGEVRCAELFAAMPVLLLVAR